MNANESMQMQYLIRYIGLEGTGEDNNRSEWEMQRKKQFSRLVIALTKPPTPPSPPSRAKHVNCFIKETCTWR